MEAITRKGRQLVTLSRNKHVHEAKPLVERCGGDLLLRLFESEWFNSWICLQYLYQHPNSGVEDYLCNKLNELPEPSIEQYLLQFVYLAANRPGSALERTIIGLCSKSFVIAIKVHWLLLALCQDQNKEKHLDVFRDKCERAALDGRWEVPFNSTQVENILSPQHSMLSPVTSGPFSILSPIMKPPSHAVMGSSPAGESPPNSIMLTTPGILNKIDEGVELMPHSHSPRLLSSALKSIEEDDLQDGPPDSMKLHTRMNLIRAELGEGEGVTALLDSSCGKGGLISVTEDEMVLSDDEYGGMGYGCPLSPRAKVRHDAYGGTLDFLEALCDTSFALVSIPLQEERQRALRHGLESINRDLNKQARQNVAVWFPLGSCNERVLRIVSKEAVLLNSREKAPFMLFIEVLETGDAPAATRSLAPKKSVPNTPSRGSLDFDTLAHNQALTSREHPKEFMKDSANLLLGREGARTPPHARPSNQHAQHAHGAGRMPAATGVAHASASPQTPVSSSEGRQAGHVSTGVNKLPGSGAEAKGEEGKESHTKASGGEQAPEPPQLLPQQQQQQQQQPPASGPCANSLVIPQRRRQVSRKTTEEVNLNTDSTAAAPAAAGGEQAQRLSGTLVASSATTDPQQQQQQQQQQQLATSSIGSSIAAAAHETTDPQQQQQLATSSIGSSIAAAATPAPATPTAGREGGTAGDSGSSHKQLGCSSGGITSAAAVAASGMLSPPHPFLPQQQQQQQQHRETSGMLSNVVRSLCFTEPTADLPGPMDQVGHPSYKPTPLHLPTTSAHSHHHAAQGLARFGWFDSNSSTQPGANNCGDAVQSGQQPNSGSAQSKSQGTFTEEELQELMAAGCLSPTTYEGPREKELMSRMAGVMASLRGDAPIVRLNLKVLEPPPHSQGQHSSSSSLHRSSPPRPRSPLPLLSPRDSTPPRSGSRRARTPPRSGRLAEELRSRFTSDRGDKDKGEASSDGVGAKGGERGEKDKGTPKLSIGPISLGRRRSSPGMSAVPIAEHEAAVAAANGDGSDSDRGAEVCSSPPGVLKEKSLSILSRLGLCRRPTPGMMLCDSDEAEEGAAGEGRHPHLRSRSSQGRPASSRGSGSLSATQRERERRRQQRPERLVAVSLEVAGGLDLSIPSPYRKSRRTPSSEAISLVASKLKISSMPPPHHSGPPLNLPPEYLPPAPAGDSVSDRPWGSEVSTTHSETGLGPHGPASTGGPPDRESAAGGKGAGAGYSGVGGSSTHLPLLPLPHSPPSRSDNFLTTAANFGSNLLSSAAAMAAAALGAGAAASSSAPPVSQQQEPQPQHLVSASSLSFQSGVGGGSSYWQHPPASTHTSAHSPPNYFEGIVSAAAAAELSTINSPKPAHAKQPAPPHTPSHSTSGLSPELQPQPMTSPFQHNNFSNEHTSKPVRHSSPSGAEPVELQPPLQLPPSEAQLPPQQRQGYQKQQQQQQPAIPTSAFHLQATLPEEIQLSMPPGIAVESHLEADTDASATQGEHPNTCSGTPRSPSHRSHRRSQGGRGANSIGAKNSSSNSMGCRAAVAATAAAAAEACLVGAQQQQQQQQQQSSSGCAVAGGVGCGGGAGGRQGEDACARGQHSALPANGMGPSVGCSPSASPSPGPHKFGSSTGSPLPMATPGIRYMAPPCSVPLGPAAEAARQEAWAVYGERWADKVERLKRESPHGQQKGWALRGIIVKSGDDCRQELLAVQLVRAFAEIFQDAGLPLRLRHYDVLVTSNRTALIEVVPDSLSIHTVKHRSPYGASLSDHFFAKWPRGTQECVAAQRHLTESLAAYSIICYLLQIKDRHNGNILLDDQGCLVHIDFGFMLSNSPGGVNFEAAPFKLTREMLEVMDSNSEGKPSEMFDYFKVLVIQGFLACRKHHDRLLLMVRMMSRSGFPCFKQGERSVKALEKRFQLHLTEVQCVQSVLGLISDSLDAWRTRQYDYYQRLLNGIL